MTMLVLLLLLLVVEEVLKGVAAAATVAVIPAEGGPSGARTKCLAPSDRQHWAADPRKAGAVRPENAHNAVARRRRIVLLAVRRGKQRQHRRRRSRCIQLAVRGRRWSPLLLLLLLLPAT